VPRFSSRSFVSLALLLVCGLALLAHPPVARAGTNADRTEPARMLKPGSTQPVFEIQTGIGGDIFPAFANYASFQGLRERMWGTVTVTVSNSTDALLRERITVEVPGWSDREIRLVEVAPGQVAKFLFAPSFLPRLYENRELTAATALVTVTDEGGNVVFDATAPVRIRSAEDMYWGSGFQYAPFIASWVTPHDSRVEEVLAQAKEFVPGRRLPGYEAGKPAAVQRRSTTIQAQAIYRALQQVGLSYVKSSGAFGSRGNAPVAERVRLPRESLEHVSANCIDGAVLYASLFENLGMDAVVVLVPGHAYVGVRLAEKAEDYLYLETALTGRASFESAVQSAERGLAKYPKIKVLRIPINQSRQAGIFPMPEPHSREEQAVTRR